MDGFLTVEFIKDSNNCVTVCIVAQISIRSEYMYM